MQKEKTTKINEKSVGADDLVCPNFEEIAKNKKGITLIALIITIIVMLILAGVSVTVALNGGLFSTADEAKDKTQAELDAEKELDSGRIKVGDVWYDSAQDYADGKPSANQGEGAGSVGATSWIDNGDKTFTKGDITVKIGDYVDYKCAEGLKEGATKSYTSYGSPTEDSSKSTESNKVYYNEGRANGYSDQTFTLYSYDNGTWRVLGVKDGKLQLISTTPIKPGSSDYYLKGQAGYQYGVEELNAISAMYAQGAYADSGRSVHVEDINKITGYDPANTGINHDQGPYGKNKIYEYGNKVTYYWDGTSNPYYEIKEGEEIKKSGSLTGSNYSSKFWWFEDGQWESSDNPGTNASTTNKIKINEKAIESNYYYYYPETLTKTGNSTKPTDVWYDLLFGFTGSRYYWLASESAYTDSSGIYFCVRYVYQHTIGSTDLVRPGDVAVFASREVRPVVSLKSDVELEEGENGTSWKIVKNAQS